jgi:hypothetical protein
MMTLEVDGKRGVTGRMKVRRQRRISLLSGSCTTGSDASASASPGEFEVSCISSPRIGELLAM